MKNNNKAHYINWNVYQDYCQSLLLLTSFSITFHRVVSILTWDGDLFRSELNVLKAIRKYFQHRNRDESLFKQQTIFLISLRFSKSI